METSNFNTELVSDGNSSVNDLIERATQKIYDSVANFE